jgi:hypothetical protein
VKKDEEDFSVEEKTGEREPFKQIELNLKKVLFRLSIVQLKHLFGFNINVE